ncbi:MAG: hypothetical protein V1793_03900 [Pseudomonadota bacterium]
MALIHWFEHQLEILNIPVHLNTEINKEFILSHEFDVPATYLLGDARQVISCMPYGMHLRWPLEFELESPGYPLVKDSLKFEK